MGCEEVKARLPVLLEFYLYQAYTQAEWGISHVGSGEFADEYLNAEAAPQRRLIVLVSFSILILSWQWTRENRP